MRYALIGFIIVPFSIGYLIRRATFGYDYQITHLTALKHDFMLGSVLFHAFLHLVVEGIFFVFLDSYFGTQLVAEYNQAVALARLLFVTDASSEAGNGLVISSERENVPIPKALFVPPYTVHEVQAMRMWDLIESSYAKPFLRKIFYLILSVQLGHLFSYLAELYGIGLHLDEVLFVFIF